MHGFRVRGSGLPQGRKVISPLCGMTPFASEQVCQVTPLKHSESLQVSLALIPLSLPGQAWWCMPAIPAFEKQEGCECEARLAYTNSRHSFFFQLPTFNFLQSAKRLFLLPPSIQALSLSVISTGAAIPGNNFLNLIGGNLLWFSRVL